MTVHKICTIILWPIIIVQTIQTEVYASGQRPKVAAPKQHRETFTLPDAWRLKIQDPKSALKAIPILNAAFGGQALTAQNVPVLHAMLNPADFILAAKHHDPDSEWGVLARPDASAILSDPKTPNRVSLRRFAIIRELVAQNPSLGGGRMTVSQFLDLLMRPAHPKVSQQIWADLLSLTSTWLGSTVVANFSARLGLSDPSTSKVADEIARNPFVRHAALEFFTPGVFLLNPELSKASEDKTPIKVLDFDRIARVPKILYEKYKALPLNKDNIYRAAAILDPVSLATAYGRLPDTLAQLGDPIKPATWGQWEKLAWPTLFQAIQENKISRSLIDSALRPAVPGWLPIFIEANDGTYTIGALTEALSDHSSKPQYTQIREKITQAMEKTPSLAGVYPPRPTQVPMGVPGHQVIAPDNPAELTDVRQQMRQDPGSQQLVMECQYPGIKHIKRDWAPIPPPPPYQAPKDPPQIGLSNIPIGARGRIKRVPELMLKAYGAKPMGEVPSKAVLAIMFPDQTLNAVQQLRTDAGFTWGDYVAIDSITMEAIESKFPNHQIPLRLDREAVGYGDYPVTIHSLKEFIDSLVNPYKNPIRSTTLLQIILRQIRKSSEPERMNQLRRQYGLSSDHLYDMAREIVQNRQKMKQFYGEFAPGLLPMLAKTPIPQTNPEKEVNPRNPTRTAFLLQRVLERIGSLGESGRMNQIRQRYHLRSDRPYDMARELIQDKDRLTQFCGEFAPGLLPDLSRPTNFSHGPARAMPPQIPITAHANELNTALVSDDSQVPHLASTILEHYGNRDITPATSIIVAALVSPELVQSIVKPTPFGKKPWASLLTDGHHATRLLSKLFKHQLQWIPLFAEQAGKQVGGVKIKELVQALTVPSANREKHDPIIFKMTRAIAQKQDRKVEQFFHKIKEENPWTDPDVEVSLKFRDSKSCRAFRDRYAPGIQAMQDREVRDRQEGKSYRFRPVLKSEDPNIEQFSRALSTIGIEDPVQILRLPAVVIETFGKTHMTEKALGLLVTIMYPESTRVALGAIIGNDRSKWEEFFVESTRSAEVIKEITTAFSGPELQIVQNLLSCTSGSPTLNELITGLTRPEVAQEKSVSMVSRMLNAIQLEVGIEPIRAFAVHNTIAHKSSAELAQALAKHKPTLIEFYRHFVPGLVNLIDPSDTTPHQTYFDVISQSKGDAPPTSARKRITFPTSPVLANYPGPIIGNLKKARVKDPEMASRVSLHIQERFKDRQVGEVSPIMLEAMLNPGTITSTEDRSIQQGFPYTWDELVQIAIQIDPAVVPPPTSLGALVSARMHHFVRQLPADITFGQVYNSLTYPSWNEECSNTVWSAMAKAFHSRGKTPKFIKDHKLSWPLSNADIRVIMSQPEVRQDVLRAWAPGLQQDDQVVSRPSHLPTRRLEQIQIQDPVYLPEISRIVLETYGSDQMNEAAIPVLAAIIDPKTIQIYTTRTRTPPYHWQSFINDYRNSVPPRGIEKPCADLLDRMRLFIMKCNEISPERTIDQVIMDLTHPMLDPRQTAQTLRAYHESLDLSDEYLASNLQDVLGELGAGSDLVLRLIGSPRYADYLEGVAPGLVQLTRARENRWLNITQRERDRLQEWIEGIGGSPSSDTETSDRLLAKKVRLPFPNGFTQAIRQRYGSVQIEPSQGLKLMSILDPDGLKGAIAKSGQPELSWRQALDTTDQIFVKEVVSKLPIRSKSIHAFITSIRHDPPPTILQIVQSLENPRANPALATKIWDTLFGSVSGVFEKFRSLYASFQEATPITLAKAVVAEDSVRRAAIREFFPALDQSPQYRIGQATTFQQLVEAGILHPDQYVSKELVPILLNLIDSHQFYLLVRSNSRLLDTKGAALTFQELQELWVSASVVKEQIIRGLSGEKRDLVKQTEIAIEAGRRQTVKQWLEPFPTTIEPERGLPRPINLMEAQMDSPDFDHPQFGEKAYLALSKQVYEANKDKPLENVPPAMVMLMFDPAGYRESMKRFQHITWQESLSQVQKMPIDRISSTTELGAFLKFLQAIKQSTIFQKLQTAPVSKLVTLVVNPNYVQKSTILLLALWEDVKTAILTKEQIPTQPKKITIADMKAQVEDPARYKAYLAEQFPFIGRVLE
ncbi:MAG: hypothetical protein LBJ77_03070 [Holosporales bacterium]|nr:hypothetical protein [Holosporales bacterium]